MTIVLDESIEFLLEHGKKFETPEGRRVAKKYYGLSDYDKEIVDFLLEDEHMDDEQLYNWIDDCMEEEIWNHEHYYDKRYEI